MTLQVTHYLLKNVGTAAPVLELQTNSISLKALLPDLAEDKILLAGGFPSGPNDPGLPLSATLQINGDCADLNDAELTQLATAEWERHRSITYRTYTVEPDHGLCVISGDKEKLERFCDTYGGLLELEPLLMASGHPDYPEVSELEVNPQEEGCTVTYAKRAPIDFSRCTYCRQCGSVCPESCISEQVVIDFSVCTFCKDCEKACPTGAVDISAVERCTLEVPAVLSIDPVPADIPRLRGVTYTQDQIEDYLATRYPFQVEEVIGLNRALCHYLPASNSGCTICLETCKHSALVASEEAIAVDHRKCVECGECVGTCPTGALQHLRFDDKMFLDYFHTFELPVGSRVVLGSEADLQRTWWRSRDKRYLDTFFLALPSVNSLTMMHLLRFAVGGATEIIILSDAPDHKHHVLNHTVKETNRLTGALLSRTDFVRTSTLDQLLETLVQPPSDRHTLSVQLSAQHLNRRRKLADFLQSICKTTAPESPPVLQQLRDFGTISCDPDACTYCMACLNVCKIESLACDRADNSLTWTGSFCINCGACVAICPEDALSASSEAVIDATFFEPLRFGTPEPICCVKCGKVFGNKKSYERVMTILNKQQRFDASLLDHCEECRVIALIESK